MTDRRQASHPWHSSLAKEKAVQMTAESTKACTAACSSAGVHDAQILFPEGVIGSVKCDLGAECLRYMLPKHCQSNNDCDCLGRSALSRC